MLRIAAVLAVLAGSAASAQSPREQIDLANGYVACAKFQIESERLTCYDNMVPNLTNFIDSITESLAECRIEDFTYRAIGRTGIKITGAVSCSSGRMDYRLFDGDNFLMSGFTFIRGYAFQIGERDFPMPENLIIKYTVEQ